MVPVGATYRGLIGPYTAEDPVRWQCIEREHARISNVHRNMYWGKVEGPCPSFLLVVTFLCQQLLLEHVGDLCSTVAQVPLCYDINGFNQFAIQRQEQCPFGWVF